MQYNQEQMRHILDEAREKGKEMVEEAPGTDEEKGVLSESMEDIVREELSLTEEELTGRTPAASPWMYRLHGSIDSGKKDNAGK